MRRWVFRIFTVLFAPCVILLGVEGVLRLAGFGYSTALFKPMSIGGHEYLVENDSFSHRFFPPELARVPGPIRMEPHKAPDTYRIFILGESAAMGDPEPAFGAGRYLEMLLRERFPETHFEIVNVAFTAINSHVILPIARECAAQSGDLWIIYMGNNEMVGPFGAATVFGPKAPPLVFVRLSLAIQETRVGQLLTAITRKMRSGSKNLTTWGGMQMFVANRVAPGGAAKDVVYRNFDRNLRGILTAGRGCEANILLNTVAVNLRDCAPFASFVDTNLPAETRTKFQRWYDQGRALENEGKYAEAASAYERASGLNAQFAEVEFRWGDCLARLGDSSARVHFEKACDLDALPFRTDSRLNAIIRRAGRDVGGTKLHFLDSASLLATNNAAGVPGEETFYEHVHFNFDGNYRLARLWAEQVSALLPSRFMQRATESWASQAVCERRFGLTDWNRLIVVRDVQHRMQQQPLSGQYNNAKRLEALGAWEANLRRGRDAAGSAAARQIYREAIERSPDDYCLYESFGSFLAASGDIAGAAAQWQRVRELVPGDYLANFRVGELLAQLNRPAESEAALLEASRLRPFLNDAWTELGKVYSNQGQYQLALKQFDRALELQPLDFEAWFQSGIALSKSNRRSEAMEHYRQALRINPVFWQAHFELGGQLGLQGNIAEAKRELEQAVHLQPGFAPAHLNLGVALMKEGQLDSAAKEFEETLRLDPQNKLAPNYLAQVNAIRGRDR